MVTLFFFVGNASIAKVDDTKKNDGIKLYFRFNEKPPEFSFFYNLH